LHFPIDAHLTAIASRLPDTDGIQTVTFDKAPGYLETNLHPEIAKQMRKHMPGTKMVFTVCDPAERLFSEFQHLRRVQMQLLSENIALPEDFSEFHRILEGTADVCVEHSEECKKLGWGHFQKGMYASNLHHWLQVYPREDILVLDMESERTEQAQKLLEFAGLSPHNYPFYRLPELPTAFRNPQYPGRNISWQMYGTEMCQLSHRYRKSNEELADLIHVQYPFDHWKSSFLHRQNATFLANCDIPSIIR
jgi:hypothetical protein